VSVAAEAEALVELASEHFRLARDERDRSIAIWRQGPNLAVPIRGRGNSLESRLACLHAERYDTVPRSAAFADAMRVLEAHCYRARVETHLRVGKFGDGVVLDLGDDDGHAAIIGPNGWYLAPSPLTFRRTPLTRALPIPKQGGDLDDIRRALNVEPVSWPLVAPWVVSTLMPDIAHPILALVAQQGSAKSVTAKRLVELIDPVTALLSAPPRNAHDWAITADGSWIIGLDNIGSISDDFADSLCRVVTGDGYRTRTLYTTNDITVLAYRRCVVLTAIDMGLVRGDLADRIAFLDLKPIQPRDRRTDTELDAEWQQLHPYALGAVLDLTAQVLTILPEIKVHALPRMADFAKVCSAVDQILGRGSFETFLRQRHRVAEDTIDEDPVGRAVHALVTELSAWNGTMADLSKVLARRLPPRELPSNPRALSSKLSHLAGPLRELGVLVVAPLRNARPRTWSLSIITGEQSRPRPSEPTPDPIGPPERRVDAVGHLDDRDLGPTQPTAAEPLQARLTRRSDGRDGRDGRDDERQGSDPGPGLTATGEARVRTATEGPKRVAPTDQAAITHRARN
jgi:hypothetical protein